MLMYTHHHYPSCNVTCDRPSTLGIQARRTNIHYILLYFRQTYNTYSWIAA